MSERHGRRAMVERVADVGVAALAGASLLLACVSSSSSTTTTVSGSGESSSKLDWLTGNVKVAQKSTLQAVFTATGSASTSTITLAASAFTAVISIYNGSSALTVMKTWQLSIAARLAGVSLTFSDETIVGHRATCAHWRRSDDQTTSCVTTNGIVVKVRSPSGSSGGESFQLTSYLTSAPASAFAIPQNATIVTIPTGASAP